MQKYKSNITTTSGAAVRGVPVHVLAEDGSPASIFLDRAGTVQAANPLSTASDGTFYFYAENGRYSLRTTVDGVTITDADVALLWDPAEVLLSGPLAEAVERAEASAAQAEAAVADSGIVYLVASAQNAVVDAQLALAEASGFGQSAQEAEDAAASAVLASQVATDAANLAVDAAQDAILASAATIKAYATHAEAAIAASLLPDGADAEVYQDETRAGARTRYKVQAGALVFVVNLDQVRIDLANASALDPAKGAAMVGYKGETLAGVIARHEGLSVYVESFRKDGATTRSDSNTIRSALDFIKATQAENISRLIFEAGRLYTYDRTAELTTINDLTLDLNGATLVRAAAATTRTTLAQAAGTGQSTLYLAAIPANWEVGDYLTAYTDNTDANTSKNVVVIQSIVPAENRVTVNAGFGPVGALTTILPVGTKVAKKFQAFAGRPSSTEAGIPTSGGVNSNVHIINGAINGNSANQENNSWFFNTEIMLHGRASSIRGVRFRDTAGECIVGHGVRVDGNEFRNLQGSAFHLSMHDDSAALSSASWFTNNVTNGTNLATQAVNGHCEGAVTFSWGAGRLIVSGNEFLNGSESVLGAFGPANEASNADKWLVFSGNICRNFTRLFYGISEPAEGVVVTDNILIDCDSATLQMLALLGATNSVGGNVCIGNSAVTGAFRATGAVFGTASKVISQVKLLAGADVAGFDIARISAATVATTGDAAFHAFVTANSGAAGHSFYMPGGAPAGDFFAVWRPATSTYELLGNTISTTARVSIKNAFLSLPNAIQTYADNAGAKAGGLSLGDVYQTAAGQLMRVTT